MPIKPENRGRYPANWQDLRAQVRARSGGQCECDGRCGCWWAHIGLKPGERCRHRNGDVNARGSIVVLTTAHLDHQPENSDLDNLGDYCQACHLSYDSAMHQANARATRRARKADADLFPKETPDG